MQTIKRKFALRGHSDMETKLLEEEEEAGEAICLIFPAQSHRPVTQEKE